VKHLTRRDFVKLLGTTTGLGLTGFPLLGNTTNYRARVVVIGGGYGGATFAKYLRLANPHIQVTLIAKDRQYISCALSNEVLANERNLESLTFNYDGLEHFYGVNMVYDKATEIEPIKKRVTTQGGQSFDYDRLVLSPGVDFRWDAIEGYDESATKSMPHAWFAGEQTLLLRRQLDAMSDGGTVLIVAPPNPYKCPPGPYERAGLIAHYLQHTKKGNSKIVILDAKDDFAKKALFEQAWEQHFPGMIKWVSGSEDGKVQAVNPKTMTLTTEFDEHKGDVVNVIPPQKAGVIAESAGLTDDTGWYPVNQRTFESMIHKDIHVIGDACIAGPMPKSAYSANTQAKVCATAIDADINGNPTPEPSYVNTCYSIPAPGHGISVAAVYRLEGDKIVAVKGAGGVSKLEGSAWEREMEAAYARSWFDNITSDIFL
jgi:sulfide dehydrogenase [flavocytochrome c] flavoprotein subunit